ncbi:HAD family hydrolase [Iodobacter sp. CM08]|uniref:HAD family hydrolase n=1 Tax=Iodobacter sp. CM08 TaxID=3085902 RepID=UPI0029829EF1|nr:HAD family hydrolase [Iodobacter sp. CM08]MDW5416137.1 HAD family hydrolase [Iodobacter sp. CM08]
MALAIFDLDDTLIDGDSASLFLQFLVDEGVAEHSMLAQEAALMRAYHQGVLRMEDYMLFTLQALRGRSVDKVAAWVAVFIERCIAPCVFSQASATLAKHRAAGDRIVIVSATGEHIVGPIAHYLAIDDYLAINLVVKNQQYTGEVQDVLTYQQGKVLRLQEWLHGQDETLQGSYGYSDSGNDIPLLSAVSLAYVVNPDQRLKQYASRQGWRCLSWKN